MSTKFYTLLTDIGAAKLASAAALGVPLKITHMAVGDGGGALPTPDAKQTALVNEKRRAALNMLYTVKSITGALRRWVEANPELTGTLMKVAAVVAAVTVGLGTLAVALAAVLGPLAVIRLGFSVLGIKTLPSVTAAVTRISSALSWLAGAPLALLRRGLASSGNAAGLLTAPLSSLRRTASLTGNVLKTVVGVPVALLRSGLSGLRAVAVMFMNPLAALRGGLAAAGAVLRVLASGPLAMLRVALYAITVLRPVWSLK